MDIMSSASCTKKGNGGRGYSMCVYIYFSFHLSTCTSSRDHPKKPPPNARSSRVGGWIGVR